MDSSCSLSFAVAIIATNQVRRAVTNSVNDSFRVISGIYQVKPLQSSDHIRVANRTVLPGIDDCRYHAGFCDFGDKLLIDAVTVFLAFMPRYLAHQPSASV